MKKLITVMLLIFLTQNAWAFAPPTDNTVYCAISFSCHPTNQNCKMDGGQFADDFYVFSNMHGAFYGNLRGAQYIPPSNTAYCFYDDGKPSGNTVIFAAKPGVVEGIDPRGKWKQFVCTSANFLDCMFIKHKSN